ncbi:hypothetical protein TEA_026031 [Camellia sinensis var. sinensis]|uniref:AP2/ERF domain-containing protein n=1 Tax=Camellia sinensis var. sinensis TaxID=542762 RepID=A0A4V3WQX5_CAMSN|nr:hypothetical protein TEA_026031 [Camellia sinensis var. sinensis]
MGSMNSNNWLSFPLSPTHPSLPANLHNSQSHHFSLGLVNENIDNPFQNQEWNLINAHGSDEVPKVADFLGVSSKSENQTDLVGYSEIQANDTDYLFQSNNLVPVQNALGATPNNYELQENASSLHQSLTLSMGSGKGSTCETTVENSNSITTVEAAPRRTLDTFGQRTSIYRGVTRHRWTGRYEAHLWDNSCRREGQSRKGRQGTEEEAAEAYDIAAIKFRGLNAVTNFDMNRYDVKAILESNTLPIGGGAAKRLKEAQAIESSRKREEMIALGSSFQYGSSRSETLQAYPLLQQSPYEQPQPLLSLQHQDISQYAQDSSQFHQNYLQTQLQLHQQSGSYLHHSNQNPQAQFYNNYYQTNPVLLHGLMNMGGSSSSVMDNNGSSGGSYSGGGYLGGGLGMASNSTPTNAGGSAEELALVKVDYDMPSTGYGSWSGDSVQGSNPGVFTMWND